MTESALASVDEIGCLLDADTSASTANDVRWVHVHWKDPSVSIRVVHPSGDHAFVTSSYQLHEYRAPAITAVAGANVSVT
jgi:hypothetical protein